MILEFGDKVLLEIVSAVNTDKCQTDLESWVIMPALEELCKIEHIDWQV